MTFQAIITLHNVDKLIASDHSSVQSTCLVQPVHVLAAEPHNLTEYAATVFDSHETLLTEWLLVFITVHAAFRFYGIAGNSAGHRIQVRDCPSRLLKSDLLLPIW
jgi:hypothetical protein